MRIFEPLLQTEILRLSYVFGATLNHEVKNKKTGRRVAELNSWIVEIIHTILLLILAARLIVGEFSKLVSEN